MNFDFFPVCVLFHDVVTPDLFVNNNKKRLPTKTKKTMKNTTTHKKLKFVTHTHQCTKAELISNPDNTKESARD